MQHDDTTLHDIKRLQSSLEEAEANVRRFIGSHDSFLSSRSDLEDAMHRLRLALAVANDELAAARLAATHL